VAAEELSCVDTQLLVYTSFMSKNLILAVILALATGIGQVKANILNEMIGNWKTTGAVYQNGSKIYNATGSSRVTRNGKRGLYSVGTVKVGNLPSATSHLWMYDNGSCSGYIKQGSTTIGNFSGSWSATKNTLTQKISVSTPSVNYTQTATSTLVNKRKFTSTSTASNGLRVVSTSTK
jgi:hypothetical protein